jgi:hypothetical protein
MNGIVHQLFDIDQLGLNLLPVLAFYLQLGLSLNLAFSWW